MPPRIPPHRLSQPTSCQCFRTRPSSTPETSTRQFHASPHHAARERKAPTRFRALMFDWLNGPGKVFKEPLPNSTNYLSAYDRQGNLLRMRKSEPSRDKSKRKTQEPDEEALQAQDREDGLDEAEIESRSKQRQEDKANLEARGGIPKERTSDLKPYPLNSNFISQPVLSEELRERLYELVVEEGVDLKSVSAAFSVDLRRVAAVARLKTIEKKWAEEGKPLAKPYSKAVLSMVPTTPYQPESKTPPRHESINDLPVHPATRHQLFISTSESRDFNRADAAKAFSKGLLPADDRIAHPELVELTKWELAGHDRETRLKLMRERDAETAARREEKERKEREWKARTQVVVPGRRWDFKFQDFSAEKVGKDGRRRGAVGLRYGMPHEDRKRGQYKLPQKVE